MKLIALALALFLLLIPSYKPLGIPQNTQVKNAELLKLEAQFKQIDKESDPVKVKVTGDKEPSGKVNISVEREVPTEATATDSADADASKQTGKKKTVKTKETLLDIDLSKIEVPDAYINEKIAGVF